MHTRTLKRDIGPVLSHSGGRRQQKQNSDELSKLAAGPVGFVFPSILYHICELEDLLLSNRIND